MLGILDTELFPDNCEVVEMPLHNQWVYLIYKNGNSSLKREAKHHGYALLRNEQIQQLEFVDVYIRNPRARYVSGVNTYLQHITKDYPELDYNTAFWFAKRYQFLNRHYLPQFYWIQNLSRFLRPDAELRFRNFSTFGSITSIRDRAKVVPPTQAFVQQLLDNNKDAEFLWHVDQILLNLAGQSMTWSALVEYFQTNFPDIAAHVLPTA
jgi:hypothetical protein